jgi:hypothetical protein
VYSGRLLHNWNIGPPPTDRNSYAGDAARFDVNQTFIQPFISYTTPDAWTFGVALNR